MGLFHKKKKDPPPPQEQKIYIQGAGGSIVSKSILNGTSRLKWLFRQESEHGNGWVAFGDTDTQEYVDNAANMAVVDFNTLANIEPAAANVFWLPPGADLELREDGGGKYFVDTRTGQEYREPVKHPAQEAFERNLKFLNQETYPASFFQGLFTEGPGCRVLRPGRADFPTGEVVLADPLAYLGGPYETVLERRIPAGSWPVELSVCQSRIAGPRIAAARLVLREEAAAVRYEIAMPKGKRPEDLGKPGVFTFFGVDTGLACFADKRFSEAWRDFWAAWERDHPNRNKYTDHFDAMFRAYSDAHPEAPVLSVLPWELPDGTGTVLFSSGMGDGMYSGYWGLDEAGEPVSLTAVFLNPEYF